MEFEQSLEKTNCFLCAQREGAYCVFTDQFLALINVEGNILTFQEQVGCPAFVDRRDI